MFTSVNDYMSLCCPPVRRKTRQTQAVHWKGKFDKTIALPGPQALPADVDGKNSDEELPSKQGKEINEFSFP